MSWLIGLGVALVYLWNMTTRPRSLVLRVVDQSFWLSVCPHCEEHFPAYKVPDQTLARHVCSQCDKVYWISGFRASSRTHRVDFAGKFAIVVFLITMSAIAWIKLS